MASGCAPPKLEEFILTEKLGSGTYATVYKAYRKVNSREVVAIKCVSKKSLNKASVENLLTEIEILKTVRHPHIVQLKDFQWDSENIYLIMEFCAGGDLSHFIRTRRALPEGVARRFLQQLASALQYLHERNISHLDLKPQNILVSSRSTPHLKLADESDRRRKAAIRSKVTQYLSRAEELKLLVAKSNRANFEQAKTARDILKEMSQDKPRLLAALEIGSVAIAKDEEGDDSEETLDLYQQSLGELLLMLA
ncbi:hypothetical protein chiPu_0018734, partial [Chiloscyllium punctatum]|nr:hypothetical protein [Chiloscyllium punctatum]